MFIQEFNKKTVKTNRKYANKKTLFELLILSSIITLIQNKVMFLNKNYKSCKYIKILIIKN